MPVVQDLCRLPNRYYFGVGGGVLGALFAVFASGNDLLMLVDDDGTNGNFANPTCLLG